MTDPLALLTDLEKNPGARKYTSHEYNLEGYRDWLKQARVPVNGTGWIHIAGTKGKGSTASMIEALLRSFGCCTGLYTSPHMDHFGERYRIDGETWTLDRFRAAVRRLHPQIDSNRTVFEVLTAVAFLEFTDAEVDAGILETGLGGRLDCTNVITNPEVCVITSIGLDHTRILGNTIESIAREKAGIIKQGSPVVVFDAIDEDSEHARNVIVNYAEQTGAPVYGPVRVECEAGKRGVQAVTSEWLGREFSLQFPLAGKFQGLNLGLALRAVEVFLKSSGHAGVKENEARKRASEIDRIRNAMPLIRWPGRMELIHSSPPLLLDAAHCPLSAKALGESLHDFSEMLPATLVWGMQRDKDRSGFFNALISHAPDGSFGSIVCYKVPGARGAEAEDLAAIAGEKGFQATVAESPAEAWKLATKESRRPVVVCGTVYTIGEFRRLAMPSTSC